MTPWTAARQASLFIANSWSLLKLTSSVIPFSHLRSFPTSGSFPISQLFMSGGKSIKFCFSFSPSNEHSGLISFRMDWLDLLAVQEALKSLLQQYSSKASILYHSAFFIVQLTSIHDYWKNYSFDYMDLCWQSDVSAF